MVELGYTWSAYKESFTPDRISEFRSRCRVAVDTLLASGESPADVVVEGVHVDLRGWVLHSVVPVQGWEGDEWYRWTRSAVLGEDGELYDVKTRKNQLRGKPYDEDGNSAVTPVRYSEMDLWDQPCHDFPRVAAIRAVPHPLPNLTLHYCRIPCSAKRAAAPRGLHTT